MNLVGKKRLDEEMLYPHAQVDVDVEMDAYFGEFHAAPCPSISCRGMAVLYLDAELSPEDLAWRSSSRLKSLPHVVCLLSFRYFTKNTFLIVSSEVEDRMVVSYYQASL